MIRFYDPTDEYRNKTRQMPDVALVD